MILYFINITRYIIKKDSTFEFMKAANFLKIGDKLMVIGEKIVAEDTNLTYINL